MLIQGLEKMVAIRKGKGAKSKSILHVVEVSRIQFCVAKCIVRHDKLYKDLGPKK